MSSIVPLDIDDPEAEFVCPYYNSHVVRACRFSQHIRKCKKNHGGEGFEVCPFNATHHVPEKKFANHLATCPDKHVILQDEQIAQGSQQHVLPPVEHHPQWQKPESNEDWDLEVEVLEREKVEVPEPEELHTEEAINMSTLIPERPANWEQMSATQKKNYKRKYNRQQEQMKTLGLSAADFKRSENPEDWSEEEREAKLKAILSLYPPPTGKIESQFVDYKSVLNQYCQKNQINQPKYIECNPDSMFGGFAYEVFVNMNTYRSHGMARTKRDAAHDAAKRALLSMKLPEDEDHFSKPRAIRPIQDVAKLRQAHEVGLLHESGQLPSKQLPAKAVAQSTMPVETPAQPRLLPPDSFSRQPKHNETCMEPSSTPGKPVESNGWSTVVGKSRANGGRGRGRGRGTALAMF